MYSHGRVWDAKPDEGEPRMVEVGNAVEAVARDKAAAERDGRAQRYFASKPPEPEPEPESKDLA